MSEKLINDDGITSLVNRIAAKVANKYATKAIVTQSANGLMSAADKAKLDGIATGANKTVVDTALSSTSTNPVQNKVINSALAGKAASSHTHTVSQITDFPSSLPANGGNADHATNADSAKSFTGNNISDVNGHWRIWADAEGGNIEIKSPDKTRAVQMDCFDNNTFRIFTPKDSDGDNIWELFKANYLNGEISIDGKVVNKHDYVTGYFTLKAGNSLITDTNPDGNGKLNYFADVRLDFVPKFVIWGDGMRNYIISPYGNGGNESKIYGFYAWCSGSQPVWIDGESGHTFRWDYPGDWKCFYIAFR